MRVRDVPKRLAINGVATALGSFARANVAAHCATSRHNSLRCAYDPELDNVLAWLLANVTLHQGDLTCARAIFDLTSSRVDWRREAFSATADMQ